MNYLYKNWGQGQSEARGELIQGQDSAPDKVYIWEPSPGHGLE